MSGNTTVDVRRGVNWGSSAKKKSIPVMDRTSMYFHLFIHFKKNLCLFYVSVINRMNLSSSLLMQHIQTSFISFIIMFIWHVKRKIDIIIKFKIKLSV